MALLNTTTSTDENEALFQELFGSDSSEGDTVLEKLELEMAQLQHEALIREDCVIIEHPVPGMAVYRNALDTKPSMLFFEWLSAKYFSNTPHLQDTAATPNGPRINQGMHFGALSGAAGHAPLGILAAACMNMKGLLPHSVVDSRGRDGCLFDQAIVNLYDAGEGIGDHIDLLRFADGIVGFSFGGSATMRLRRLYNDEDVERASKYAQEDLGGSASDCVLVRLDAGDVYSMAGDARYRWTHGIPAQIGGRNNVQSRRISVTLRKLE